MEKILEKSFHIDGKKKTKNIKFITLIFLFIISSTFSQSINLKGKVLDSLQNPLAYANIVAEPTKGSQMFFTITDEKGRYQIKLLKNQKYQLKVSYLGYKSKNVIYTAKQSSIYNFVLNERAEILDEIKIDTKLAVSIKKDTITY